MAQLSDNMREALAWVGDTWESEPDIYVWTRPTREALLRRGLIEVRLDGLIRRTDAGRAVFA